MFSELQNGHILAKKLNFEKLGPLSFLQLLKLEKGKCLYFCIFWLVFRDILLQQKSIYSTFSHFDEKFQLK